MVLVRLTFWGSPINETNLIAPLREAIRFGVRSAVEFMRMPPPTYPRRRPDQQGRAAPVPNGERACRPMCRWSRTQRQVEPCRRRTAPSVTSSRRCATIATPSRPCPTPETLPHTPHTRGTTIRSTTAAAAQQLLPARAATITAVTTQRRGYGVADWGTD